MENAKNRLFEFDFLRTIAILAVILLHTSANLIVHNAQHSLNYTIGNFFDTISRFAVPFFVMISGYFMLDENKQFTIQKFKNKIIKLFILLIFWSCFYALIYDFHNFTHAFLFGHYHLWYMYLIIGLYLITPILRLFVKEENRAYILYYILLLIVFGFIPNLLNAIFVPYLASKYFNLYKIVGNSFLVYYLTGWLFHHYQNKTINLKIPLFLIIISLITMFSCVQFVQSDCYKTYKLFFSSENIPVLIYSTSLFLLIYRILNKYSKNINDEVKNFIYKCSSLSFGVYLIHACYLHLFESIFKHVQNGIYYVIILFVLTTMCSFITAYILSKIKYLKQLIMV